MNKSKKQTQYLAASLLGLFTLTSVPLLRAAPQDAKPEAKSVIPQLTDAELKSKKMFTNPIVRSRSAADPWMIYKDGYYYFTFTTGGSVVIWRSKTITGLEEGNKVTIWRAPKTGPNARDVWAPEIHFVKGKWYVYYTATDGPDANRRQFVLEAKTSDPQGEYIDRGRLIVPEEDEYAIDGTIFQAKKGALYFLWSGREKSKGGPQNIYIAPMSNPWTISGPRVKLSTPTYDWEKHGWQVNEGPEVLQKNGKTFVVYSASGGTTENYCLGMLTNTDGDFLKAESWSKSPVPVFAKYKGPDGVVYTPGHNSFCKSPDGKEDWIIYHAKDISDNTWGNRTARAQRFTWNADDTPNFGHPIPPGVPLPLPSGEKGE
jgi:GH43 family beta-xylosidase